MASQHLARIVAARAGVEDAHAELRCAVKAAHEAGESWGTIALALDTVSRPHGRAVLRPLDVWRDRATGEDRERRSASYSFVAGPTGPKGLR